MNCWSAISQIPGYFETFPNYMTLTASRLITVWTKLDISTLSWTYGRVFIFCTTLFVSLTKVVRVDSCDTRKLSEKHFLWRIFCKIPTNGHLYFCSTNHALVIKSTLWTQMRLGKVGTCNSKMYNSKSTAQVTELQRRGDGCKRDKEGDRRQAIARFDQSEGCTGIWQEVF